jgi:malate dehydrogenase
MSRKKVTVVGGGFVGSTTAQRIVDLELADVVLTDILDGPPAGKALDMMESGPITRTDSHAAGISTANGDYFATAGSDVVVITAGFPRKPGMSRDDLLKANYDVVKAVVEQIVRHSPNCVIIVVTNPLDAMAQAALKVSGFPKNRTRSSSVVMATIWCRYRAIPRWQEFPSPTFCPKSASTPSSSARARAAPKSLTC